MNHNWLIFGIFTGEKLACLLTVSGLFYAAQANAAVGQQRVADRPNILFAIADDWSSDHAGAYGCRWIKTPAFDRVAGQGLLFTRAYTPTAKCSPSRASILTGRNPWQLKDAANHVSYFPAEFKTWVEALAQHGYFTGMTGKGWGPGVATNAAGQPREMAGQPFGRRTLVPPASGIKSNDYAENFADFLTAAPQGEPWCFWYGGMEPHREYEAGSGMAKGGKQLTDIDRVPGYWPDTTLVRNDMLDYAFEVEHFDRHLGRMLQLLESRGLLSNTIIVVTSDNGMPFPRVKGQTYDDSNRMPLAIQWPAGIRNPGRVVTDYVSFIDFAPTFIDLASLQWKQTGMASPQGHSLKNIFDARNSSSTPTARDHVIIGRERNDVGRPHDQGYPVRGIVKNDLLYLHNFEPARWPSGNPETGYADTGGGPTKTETLDTRRKSGQTTFWNPCFGLRPADELYDLRRDPHCLANLADDPAQRVQKETLCKQLFKELEAQTDPRVLGQGQLFDNYPFASEELRGFYERQLRGEKIVTRWILESDFESQYFTKTNSISP